MYNVNDLRKSRGNTPSYGQSTIVLGDIPPAAVSEEVLEPPVPTETDDSFKELKLDLLQALSGATTVEGLISALQSGPVPVVLHEDVVFREKFTKKPPTGLTTSNPSILSLDELLTKLRDAAKANGAFGVSGCMRIFKKLDLNGSQSLDFKEFQQGMKTLKVDLELQDIQALFKYFDNNCDGHLDLEEFLAGIRGNLNEKRKEFVDLAFGTFDKNADGVITIKDLIGRYDPSHHPEVISGQMTDSQVFKGFLDTFDGGEKDGLVTQEEFTKYYEGISAGIVDDSYFELMMRNTWHISGGEGWSENTSCLRVLVTHEDGHQSVEEIKNDFDIKKDDIEAMKVNLAERGIKAVKISVTGDVNEPTPVMSAEPQFKTRNRYGRGAGESSIQFG